MECGSLEAVFSLRLLSPPATKSIAYGAIVAWVLESSDGRIEVLCSGDLNWCLNELQAKPSGTIFCHQLFAPRFCNHPWSGRDVTHKIGRIYRDTPSLLTTRYESHGWWRCI